MNRRYNKYLQLGSRHIVEGHMIHRELTNRIDQKDKAKAASMEERKVSYKPLHYPTQRSTRSVTNDNSIHDCETLCEQIEERQT